VTTMGRRGKAEALGRLPSVYCRTRRRRPRPGATFEIEPSPQPMLVAFSSRGRC
jgi:hypothetical protein